MNLMLVLLGCGADNSSFDKLGPIAIYKHTAYFPTYYTLKFNVTYS